MIFEKYLRALPTPASAGAGREQRAADHASDGVLRTDAGHMSPLAAILTGKRVRALAAALALGATVLTLSAPTADARPRDNGVRCAMDYGSEIHFFLVGEQAWEGSGTIRYRCNASGQWDRVGDNLPTPRGRHGGVDVR